MAEKSEEPTHKKIEDARKEGQVPVSRDLAKLASLLVVAELAFATEPLWHGGLDSLLNLPPLLIGKPFYPAMLDMFVSAGLFLLLVFGVLWLVCGVVAVVGYWGQFGVLISPNALTPKFDKLNPVAGFKQLFSGKKVIELLVTVIKACLIGLVIYKLVRAELPNIVQLSTGEPKDVYHGFVALLRSIFHTIIMLCLVLAFTDFAIQKYFFIKGLRMDKEEIKREYKESEGDPMIKGKRKQLAMQWAMEGAASQTEKSNAVVVNPTHFAVAMFYDPAAGMVPVVMAKGRDDIARAMIRRARECHIPVIRHVWLARTLYATGSQEAPVPRSSYEAVAYVYAVVNELIEAGESGREVELESRGEPPAAA